MIESEDKRIKGRREGVFEREKVREREGHREREREERRRDESSTIFREGGREDLDDVLNHLQTVEVRFSEDTHGGFDPSKKVHALCG